MDPSFRSIVIGVFIKDDIIQRQIDNILLLEGLDQFNILFYQDNIINSPKYDTPHYRAKMENVKAIIEANLNRFNNSAFMRAETNLMPFGMCKKALDIAFQTNKYAIFMEDDVFLAKNALVWFNYFYNKGMLTWDSYKFVTGESIYYDTHNMDSYPSEEQLREIKKSVLESNIHQYFIEINNFLTSSIFATTKDIWETEIRELRGSINGECVLNDAINQNNWKSIFPVIPFAKDIGMLHDDGWSVAWHGKSGVRETKNVFLMADEFYTSTDFILLPESFDKSVLYPFTPEQTTK